MEGCEICEKSGRSKSKPSVAIPRATDFNSVVTLDLKEFGNTNVLWMICGFTKMLKGAVLKDKTADSVIKGLHGGWCMNYGYPTVGFYADNGGEFKNYKMEEFTSKLGIKVEFSPAYSPWSNGINERNHYSADVAVKKIMEEDKKITLQDTVRMAGWTHNTNVNTLGFTPLQLVTGKNVTFPGVSSGNIVTESLYDDEGVKKIMERHGYINKKYREQEFSWKLKTALNARLKGYEDGIIEEDDLVYYQA